MLRAFTSRALILHLGAALIFGRGEGARVYRAPSVRQRLSVKEV